jgi:hypothetical protein|tara:strand:+ start:311 stop:529 length:219 start_codon:yes stop_codon:yes gene_type:complete
MKKLKAGDLLRLKDGSGVVGLILGPGYVSPVMRGVETMNILWSDDSRPTEVDVLAYEKGWVELVSSTDVPTI